MDTKKINRLNDQLVREGVNFKDDMAVSKFSLDEHLEEQSEIHYRYGVIRAQASFERDKAERRIKIVEAEMYERIRKEPKKYGFDEKPTVDGLKHAVAVSEEVTGAYEEAFASRRKLAAIEEAVSAIAFSRMGSLKALKDLYNGQYWSEAVAVNPASKNLEHADIAQEQRAGLRRRGRGRTPSGDNE